MVRQRTRELLSRDEWSVIRGYRCGGRRACPLVYAVVEDEPVTMLDQPEQWPRTPVELRGAIHTERLVPRGREGQFSDVASGCVAAWRVAIAQHGQYPSCGCGTLAV